ncbi:MULTISPECIES: SDR family NAD(P)-dependent oxidoreductase [Rheinheimera]|uniref:SDR family NAD(P)-dependent oxidoreductase n=1 Tax=Rheinheimera marina TaxID=1774958 RepID=A0ABV9JN52_9GAMM
MKRVLITGASSGIGEALVGQYLQHGFTVLACGRNAAKLQQLALANTAVQPLLFDITEPEQIAQAASQVSELDLLILNAGDCRYMDDVMQFDGALFESVLQTNLVATGYLLQYLLPKLKPGGQLVLVSSSATLLPFTRAQAYGASKAGLDYLAASLRLDLVRHRIGVTLVHPGFIKTPLTDKNDFSMPFLLSAEQAAARIYQGVLQRKRYLHFPKRLTLLLKTMALLPERLWFWLALRMGQATQKH